MKQEIERKYAVKNLPDNLKIESILKIQQGFIYRDFNTHIRVRKIEMIYPKNYTNYIYTLKTKGNIEYNSEYNLGRRYEIENEISKEEYEELIKNKISNIIQKTRIIIPIENNLKVEMDVYYDYLEGFLTTEVEFEDEEQAKGFIKPEWFGEEIGYKELSNGKLAKMTREEWQGKVTKEFIENNKKIINQLKEKYKI